MGVDADIDITTEDRKTILALLQRHLPGTTAWVYGSRVKWTSRPQSDLDLVVFATPEQRRQVGDLREAFEESNLPFRVDLFVWDDVPEAFRKQIETEHVVMESSSIDGNALRGAEPSHLVALDDLCDAIIDCPHSTPVWTPDGVIVLRSKNIRNGRLDLSEPSYTSEKDYAQRTKRATPRPGDLVFTREAPMGEVCMIPAGLRCCLGQRMVLLRPHSATVDPRYLLYAVQSERVQQEIRQHDGTGSTVSNLRISLLKALRIPSHRLSDQRAIAHVLGTLDDRIELNRRMNATLEAVARALFKSWFVNFDPVRAKMEGRDPGLPKDIVDVFPDRLVYSELGEMPEGWLLKPLDSVAHFQNGLALQKFRPTQSEARLPVVKIAQLRSGVANSGEWASASIRPECIIENGDVVFSWSGSLLVQTWCGGRAALNQHLFKVTSERYPKWFYLHSILSHFRDFQRIAKDKATTMGHIRRHHLTDALCVVPPDDAIARASDVFAGLLERQVASEVQRRTLGTVRDALLPKLISGEVRVHHSEL